MTSIGDEQHVRGIERAIEKNAVAMEKLSEIALRGVQIQIRRTRILMIPIFVALLFLLVFVGAIWYSQGVNSEAAQNSRMTVQYISECDTAGTKCYEDNKRREEEVIKRVGEEVEKTVSAELNRAITQVECDLTGLCPEGFVPNPALKDAY